GKVLLHPREARSGRLSRGREARDLEASAAQRRPRPRPLGRALAQLLVASTGLGFNMFLTVFLGCLVGGVVVAQTLYTSTMEHLKEFGTVKAIGGSNLDIYRILGRQAAIAAVLGFGLGLIPPYAVQAVLEATASTLKVLIPGTFLVAVF